MSIKIKNRDPKKTDFASDEIVINRKEGTLFFKSDKNLIKLSGDDLSTETVEGSSTSVWTLSGDNIFYSDGKVGIGTSTPAYTLDLGENSSTIRLVSEDDGTAIRIGAGGNSNDVTLLRVDGESSDHDGESDDSHFGFSLKYMGSRSGNANSLSIFSDAEAGTAVEALTILQDGKVGIGKTNPSTELDVPGTGSFGRIETLTISASTGDFDASTIRIGGEDFNRANLIALKEGRSLQTSSRDLGEGDSAITNITRIAAVMSVDDDSTYTKMKGIGRMATFISGSLFHDLQKSPTINLARIGDGDTNLLFSGSIVSASINGGSF